MVNEYGIHKENFRLAVHYLNERERIRQRKEQGLSPPYTDDPILQRYKFTNVLRIHDRTTRGLLRNLYLPNRDAPDEQQLLNCGIARYFGTADFMEDLGWQTSLSPKHILDVVRRRKAVGQRVFTGAYVITNGGIKGPKEEVVLHHYLQPFAEAVPELVEVAHQTKKWQVVAERMYRLKGFGGTGFMTKEVLQDAILTPLLEDCADRFTWTPCGPGTLRGLNRLFGRPPTTKVKKQAALHALRFLRSEMMDRFEPHMDEIKSHFDLHTMAFGCCEIDKYLRVHHGEGKPRSGYRPDPRPLP